MQSLNSIDYGVIGAYFVILLGIGLVLKKKASASMDDYFLGNRKIPWWLMGVSGMASWVDMTGTMVITSFLFMMGPRGLFVEFRGGAGLALIFLLLFMGKWHRRSGCMTGAEWMLFRFGQGAGGHLARIMAAISSIIFFIALLTYSFLGAGLFLSMFLPFPPWVCGLILVVVTLIYTAESGFYGVVVTDLFQMSIIIFAAVFIAIAAVVKSQGVDLGELALQVTGNTQWLTSTPRTWTEMPAGYEAYRPLLWISSFYLLKSIIQGMGQGGEPKYFGARNDRECGLLSFLFGWLMSVRWFLMIGFVILGLFLIKNQFSDTTVLPRTAALIKEQVGDVEKSQWPGILSRMMNHPDEYPPAFIANIQQTLGDDWPGKLSMVSYEGTVDPERILPAVLLSDYVPKGIRGLILVALLAAAMSTFNSFINVATAFFTRDLYQGYVRRGASNRELIYVNYLFGAVLVGVCFILAMTCRNINDIWGWLMMGLSGGLIAPLCLRMLWWRFNGGGFFIGTLVGMVAAIVQRILWPDMVEWQQFVLITLIGLAGSMAGAYLTVPVSRDVLENFYRKTRPMGFWGPVKTCLSTAEQAKTRREHIYDLLALPFTFFWQVTILLLPMQLLIKSYHAAAVTAGILAVSLLGMYLFWYRQLPQTNWYENDTEASKNTASKG